MSTKKQGFASLSAKRRKEIATKAGSVKHPNKGFGSRSKEELSKLSSEAAKARWAKVKEERENADVNVTETENQSATAGQGTESTS